MKVLKKYIIIQKFNGIDEPNYYHEKAENFQALEKNFIKGMEFWWNECNDKIPYNDFKGLAEHEDDFTLEIYERVPQ